MTLALRRLPAITHPENRPSTCRLASLGSRFERTRRNEPGDSVPNLYAIDLTGDPAMDPFWTTLIRRQFGASIDMLERAITACPDELWGDRDRQPEFWYTAYHAIFWLDLYLTGSVEGYQPPEPYGLEELDPAGLLPDRVYTRGEMLDFLAQARTRLHTTLEGLTEEQARRECRFGWGTASFAELLLYNMRHVQHHAGQLNLLLRQVTDSAPRWVAVERNPASKPGPAGAR